MKIVGLSENRTYIDSVAELLRDGFSDTGTDSWSTMDECLTTVRGSIDEKKISLIAIDENDGLLGWAAGECLYDEHTWELEVLVVDRQSQEKGVGGKLLSDFEAAVLDRKGLNVFLGSDDENERTSLGGIELYPDPLQHLARIKNIDRHPFEFYLKQGYSITGVVPDANGIGKPDIFMTKRLRLLKTKE